MFWNKIKKLPTAKFSLFNICGMLKSRGTLEGVFMSIISDLFEKITGLDLDGSSAQEKVIERPCSNCPSNCTIAGDVCELCSPYKKKLIDAVYHVDHIDEFRAQYEVVGSTHMAAATGTITCPRCGGPTANHYICDFCGAKLADAPDENGKIQVAAASDIPNPIMDAQNIIFERYNTIVKKYAADQKSSSSGSFLSNLFAELLGTETGDDEESPLGAKMSEAEIKEAAALYKVNVGDYLTGLDNGKYLTLSGKKKAAAQGQSSWSPADLGITGIAGIGMFANGFSRDFSKRPQRDGAQRPAEFELDRHSQYRDPYPQKPVQRRPQSEQTERHRPSEAEHANPSHYREKPNAQDSRPARSDHWKERDPGRRNR